MREFCVFDSSSVPITRASYAWLALETRTKKSLRPHKLLKSTPDFPNRDSLNARLGKIAVPSNIVELQPVYTRVSDLDMQKHINNARYIAWIEDALQELFPSLEIRWLQMNFLAEAVKGEKLAIHAAQTDVEGKPGAVVELSRHGNAIARACIHGV